MLDAVPGRPGFGIVSPLILYRQMIRPLIEEAPTFAAEFSRRGILLVTIDSKMFAVAGIDGAFHEPLRARKKAGQLARAKDGAS